MPKEKAMEYTSSSSNSLSAWMVLDYEIWMFLGTRHLRRHSFTGKEPEAQLVRNSLVESSLLHIRILADIFLSRRTYPDNIYLRDLGLDNLVEDDTFSKEIDALDQAYGKSKKKTANAGLSTKYSLTPHLNAQKAMITVLSFRH